MFFFERILDRISISKYKDNIILKGGLLLSSIIEEDMRTTRDMADILGHSKIEATENYYISTTEKTLKEVSEKFEQTVNQML